MEVYILMKPFNYKGYNLLFNIRIDFKLKEEKLLG